MKDTLIIITLLAIIASCNTTKKIDQKQTETIKISETAEDSTEYELIIFDIRYDTFLATQPPMQFYSDNYYQSWNVRYVTEWNIRHNNPLRYGDFYETRIDYNFNVDYGIELNYRLYNYFLFIEKEYGITLIKRGKTSR